MDAEDFGPAGLIVVGLWIEPGDRVCMRVTSSTTLRQGAVSTVVVTSRAEVLALVESWLDALTPAGR